MDLLKQIFNLFSTEEPPPHLTYEEKLSDSFLHTMQAQEPLIIPIRTHANTEIEIPDLETFLTSPELASKIAGMPIFFFTHENALAVMAEANENGISQIEAFEKLFPEYANEIRSHTPERDNINPEQQYEFTIESLIEDTQSGHASAHRLYSSEKGYRGFLAIEGENLFINEEQISGILKFPKALMPPSSIPGTNIMWRAWSIAHELEHFAGKHQQDINNALSDNSISLESSPEGRPWFGLRRQAEEIDADHAAEKLLIKVKPFDADFFKYIQAARFVGTVFDGVSTAGNMSTHQRYNIAYLTQRDVEATQNLQSPDIHDIHMNRFLQKIRNTLTTEETTITQDSLGKLMDSEMLKFEYIGGAVKQLMETGSFTAEEMPIAEGFMEAYKTFGYTETLAPSPEIVKAAFDSLPPPPDRASPSAGQNNQKQ